MSLKIGIGILFACFVAVQGFYPLQLEGGVIEKLYFTNIYIGTPPQKFTVHVDTGSGRLAVNCQGCKNCQTHPNPPLDISKSSSASLLNCMDPTFCSNCDSSPPSAQCYHNSTNYDQSWIAGFVIEDRVSLYFDGLTGGRSKLNCVNNMSSQFAEDSLIDGIWGLGKNGNAADGTFRSDGFVSQLSGHFGVERTLALCLSYEGGTMIFGGSDSSKHTKPGITVNFDSLGSDAISKSVGRMRIGQTVLHQNAGLVMADLIIDSGSTTSLLDQSTFDSINQAVENVCSSMGEDCRLDTSDPKNLCVDLSRPDLILTFPNISILMGGVEVVWPARGYLLLVDINYPSYFCFGAAVSSTGFVLGADFMLDKDIIFGQNTLTIYPDSQCGGKDFNQVISTFVSGSASINRKSQSNSTVKLILLITIPILTILAIAACFYFKRFRQRVITQEEVKIEGEGVKIEGEGVIAMATDVRMPTQAVS